MTDPTTEQEPWYKDGLQFTCTQCGDCCGGAPGEVWVSENEIVALAERLGLDVESFRRKYTRKVGRRGVSLVEKADYDCIFFDKQRGCTVYTDRPLQCRTWPFWRSNLRSQEEWDDTAATCPGMDHGEQHELGEISAVMRHDGLP